MLRFEFATATRILYGPGTLREAAASVAALGKRAVVVTGRSAGRAESLLGDLCALGIDTVVVKVSGEPTVDTVVAGVRAAHEHSCHVVVGMGGGSAIDTGKAIAALLTNPGDPLNYLEVVGRGQPLTFPSAPYVAIPTTAGTGAEVTRNAVLASPPHRLKVSLRSPLMLPRLAVVDPQLTHTLSPEITASTGLDALAQLIEPLVSHGGNPLTDALCREGVQRVARSLRRACENGQDASARQDMALASLFGGLALANARLGAIHGIAGPLGGMFPVPHGVACARLLPHAMDVNLRALRERAPGHSALERYAEIARLLTRHPQADAQTGVLWLRDLCAELAVPRLASFGLKTQDFPAVVAQAQRASSMQGNPLPLTDVEVAAILEKEAASP